MALSAGTILLAAMTILVTREFGISREQTEQVRITEDARVQMERMSDAIRDARSTDFNGDKLATLPGEPWLQSGDQYDITFLTNIDNESELELVHYFLEGTELKRGVRDPYTSSVESEQVTTIAKSLRNRARGVALFQYFPGAELAGPVVDVKGVKQVQITMVIDVNENQEPGAATVSTVVTPRASEFVFATPSPSPSPTPAPSFAPPGFGGTTL